MAVLLLRFIFTLVIRFFEKDNETGGLSTLRERWGKGLGEGEEYVEDDRTELERILQKQI